MPLSQMDLWNKEMSNNFQQTRSSQQTQLKVVAVIPCYNTEYFIGEVVSKCKKYVDQVIVVNDGSRDGTAEVAKAAGALVVNHRTNKGYGESIKSCFDAAKANKADILVTLDGDGQHNPDELPQVLAPLLTGEADLVIGSRFLQPAPPTQSIQQTLSTQQTNMPRYRGIGIGIITFAWNFGSKTKVSDAQSGFRAYNKKAMDAFDNLTEKGMSISVETLERARRKRAIITEVPISCKYVPSTLNLGAFRHGFNVARAVVKIRLKNKIQLK